MKSTSRSTRHIVDYWRILRRRRWVVLLAVATVSVVALFGSFLSTPLYRATATLQIERQNPDILTFRDLSRVDYSWAAYTDFYETEYKILASDAVARLAAERLGLPNHPVFDSEEQKPSLLARLKRLIPRRGTGREMEPLDVAALTVLAGLEIAPVRNSHLVMVSWVSPDPELAASVANSVAESYIQYNLESKYSTSDQAAEFLVDQIGMLKSEITTIEARLQEYGEAKNIVSIDDTNNITLKALADVSERRTRAQTVLAEKEAAYRAVLDASPDALPEVLHSDLIERLKGEQAEYEAELSEKLRVFKEDWPEVQMLRSKIDQVQIRLDHETEEIARKVLLSAESGYRQALEEVSELEELLAEQESAAQRLKRDAVEFANLRSEVSKKRETLDTLIARQNEMALSTRLKDLDSASSNIRLVARAKAPLAPFRPNTVMNLGLGLIVGLIVGVGAAFFLDYLDNTLGVPRDVEVITDAPVLAVIPHHEGDAVPLARVGPGEPAAQAGTIEFVAAENGKAPASEAYRELRTAILLSNPGSPPARLMVTSSHPEEGKSATAINLATVLAQLGRRVVLIDTDLRKPRLHRVFRVSNERGVSTFLSGLEDSPDLLLASTSIPELALLPSGPIPPNPSELLNSDRFVELGRSLLEAGYDHLVFDSPPVLSVTDSMIVGSNVDGLVVVVRSEKTPRQSLRQSLEKLRQAGAHVLGTILNDLRASRHGYGQYRYQYHYGDSMEPGARDGSSQDLSGRAEGA